MKTENNHYKRWILPKPIIDHDIKNCNLNYILQKVLIRRGIDLSDELDDFISPSDLPNPEDHFSELNNATHRIIHACSTKEQIAICGDYDADGITSTVLLVELLSKLGAIAKPYIPSRQDEGYGLNLKMIEDINCNQIKLIITVDNGISAIEAIHRCNQLGIDLIITDHHKIPEVQQDVFSLIHPEKTPVNSPYKFLAGVGIAFLLARNICNTLKFDINKTTANELFCIGTIADMAPLKGANRKWLKECMPHLNNTTNIGIKSILKKLSIDKFSITSEDIGFKIAPLINAVGRIGDPTLIINLLTNQSRETIDKLTNECYLMNKERKRITALIEQEALEIAYSQYRNDRKFLVLMKRDWHPGVIGIVAARIVEKFNLPTALLSLASDGKFRGSIRSNNQLKVNKALDECADLLIAHGGHSAAAGFSIDEENIPKLNEKLNKIAKTKFMNLNLEKSLEPDAQINFGDINIHFYEQLCLLGPFGIMNPAPIFWARKCRVSEIYRLNGRHLKMNLDDDTGIIDAIKWNDTTRIKKNDLLDIAFNIEINRWKNSNKIQLNVIDFKKHKEVIDLKIHNNNYKCQLNESNSIFITNNKGQCISSDLLINPMNLDKKQIAFAKKILSFAEIALGKGV